MEYNPATRTDSRLHNGLHSIVQPIDGQLCVIPDDRNDNLDMVLGNTYRIIWDHGHQFGHVKENILPKKCTADIGIIVKDRHILDHASCPVHDNHSDGLWIQLESVVPSDSNANHDGVHVRSVSYPILTQCLFQGHPIHCSCPDDGLDLDDPHHVCKGEHKYGIDELHPDHQSADIHVRDVSGYFVLEDISQHRTAPDLRFNSCRNVNCGHFCFPLS